MPAGFGTPTRVELILHGQDDTRYWRAYWHGEQGCNPAKLGPVLYDLMRYRINFVDRIVLLANLAAAETFYILFYNHGGSDAAVMTDSIVTSGAAARSFEWVGPYGPMGEMGESDYFFSLADFTGGFTAGDVTDVYMSGRSLPTYLKTESERTATPVSVERMNVFPWRR